MGTQTALTTLRFEELVSRTEVSQLTAQSWVERDLESADEIQQLGTISVQLTQGRTRKPRRPETSGGPSSSLTLAKDGLSKKEVDETHKKVSAGELRVACLC